MIEFIIGFMLGCIILLCIDKCNFFKKIKVDYSKEAKKLQKYDISGCYGIYVRKHFWNSWEQVDAYSDLDIACSRAKKIKTIPKYF